MENVIPLGERAATHAGCCAASPSDDAHPAEARTGQVGLAAVPDSPSVRGAGECLVQQIQAVADTVRCAVDQLVHLDAQGLTDAMAAVGVLVARAQGLQAAIVLEAEQRGVINESDARGAKEWVLAAAGTAGVQPCPRTAAHLQALATLGRRTDNRPILAAVTAGRIGAEAAADIAAMYRRLTGRVELTCWDEVLDAIIDAAVTGVNKRDFKGLEERILATYGRPQSLEDEEWVRYHARSMSPFRRNRDGMCEARLLLDPASEAVVVAALAALSRPAPDPETAEPDPRTANQRRADALVTLATLATQPTPGLIGSGTKAAVTVTVAYDDLVDALADLNGAMTGVPMGPPGRTCQTAASAQGGRQTQDSEPPPGSAPPPEPGSVPNQGSATDHGSAPDHDRVSNQGSAADHGSAPDHDRVSNQGSAADQGSSPGQGWVAEQVHIQARRRRPEALSARAMQPQPPARTPALSMAPPARQAFADGRPAPRAGLTLHGQVLSPATVRMHACDALILPAVLGSPSQPLDVGRQERLVTPAILAALRLRDGGCSFPGCSMPAPFCDAHHLRHWSENGDTSLVNMALLCRYHHRLIHRYRYFAITTINGVTWDLTRRYRDDDRATRKVG